MSEDCRFKKIQAAVSPEEIQKALQAKDVLIGAELEFIFKKSVVVTKPKKARSINPEVLKRLEEAADARIEITPWLKKRSHTKLPEGGAWKLERDVSLIYLGAELVSPAMPLRKFLKICPEVFKVIGQVGNTTDQCGLHIGISLKGAKFKKLNPLKLAFSIDEDFVYKAFKSEARAKWTNPIKEHMQDILGDFKRTQDTEIKPKTFQQIETAIITHLKKKLLSQLTKSTGINLGKITSGGYIEFRYMGGAGYHKKWNEVKDVIGAYISAIKQALDPDYEKESYETKLKALVEVEAKEQFKLIQEVRSEWSKPITDFLKFFHLKAKRILRFSFGNMKVEVEGSDADFEKSADAALGIGAALIFDSKDKTVLFYTSTQSPEDVAHREAIQKFLQSKAYKKADTSSPYEILKNGDVVFDTKTDLMWTRRAIGGEVTWQEAKAIADTANSSRLAGYSDWRLPTVDELSTLLKPNREIALDKHAFPEAHPAGYQPTHWNPAAYWTSEKASEEDEHHDERVYVVRFMRMYGRETGTGYFRPGDVAYVRLVRDAG